MTDHEQTQAAVDGTVERFGGIDAVVVNAGIGSSGLMRYMDPDAFEAVLRVNLIGSYRTIQTTLHPVIDRHGYILQIASAAAVLHARMTPIRPARPASRRWPTRSAASPPPRRRGRPGLLLMDRH